MCLCQLDFKLEKTSQKGKWGVEMDFHGFTSSIKLCFHLTTRYKKWANERLSDSWLKLAYLTF